MEDFYRHPQMLDGRLNKCKECAKKDVRSNYFGKIDSYRQYERERHQRPERKEQIARYQRKRRSSNPVKAMAWNMVSNAIRDGRLERLPCEGCGAVPAQAHHHDYSKPLDVKWLCFVCHRKEHGQLAYVQ